MDSIGELRKITSSILQLGASANYEELVLRRALAKLVRFGGRVGVTPEQMIEMLDEGISVPELLDYLVLRPDQATSWFSTVLK